MNPLDSPLNVTSLKSLPSKFINFPTLGKNLKKSLRNLEMRRNLRREDKDITNTRYLISARLYGLK